MNSAVIKVYKVTLTEAEVEYKLRPFFGISFQQISHTFRFVWNSILLWDLRGFLSSQKYMRFLRNHICHAYRLTSSIQYEAHNITYFMHIIPQQIQLISYARLKIYIVYAVAQSRRCRRPGTFPINPKLFERYYLSRLNLTPNTRTSQETY